MSTPLRENNRRYSYSPLLSPGSSRLVKNRYCISNTSSPQSKIWNNYSPGPLLTPTNYNTNVSTYIDCKSPGLSTRIVQYNNDTLNKSEPFVSHQAKYGSPGIFPIVHLNKKSLPIRTLPRETVTVRLISTHDSPSYTINNGSQQEEDASDNSTINVLKALREISKKRILSEDPTLVQSNHKRPRNDCQIPKISKIPEIHVTLNDVNSANDDTTKNLADKIPCVVDALAASLTSSNTSFVPSKNTLKRKVSKALLESPTEKILKQTVIEAETQTDAAKFSHFIQTVEEKTNLNEEKKEQETSIQDDVHDHVYENSLKGKLSSKLSIITGEQALLSPRSILSPPDKSKHDKHVTFNLPDEKLEKTGVNVSSAVAVVVTETNDHAKLTTPTPLNSPVSLTGVPVTSYNVTKVSTPVTSILNTTESNSFTPKLNVLNTVTASTTLTSETSKLAVPSFTSVTSSSITSLSLPKLPSSSSLVTTTASNISQSFNISGSNTATHLKLGTTTAPTFSSVCSSDLKLASNGQNTNSNASVTFSSMPKSVANITSTTSVAPIIFGSTSLPGNLTSISKSEPTAFNNSKSEATSLFNNKSGSNSYFTNKSDTALILNKLVTTSNSVLSEFVQQKPNDAKPGAFTGFGGSLNKPGGFKFDLGGASNINTSSATENKADSFTFGPPKPAVNSNFGANTTVTSAGPSSIFSTGFELKTSPNADNQNPKDELKLNQTVPGTTQQPSAATKLFDFTAKTETASVFNITTQASLNSNTFKFQTTPTTAASIFPTTAAGNSVSVPSDTNTFKFGGSVTMAPIFNSSSLSTSNETNKFKFESTSFKNTKPSTEVSSFKFAPTYTTASAFTAPAFKTSQPLNDNSAFKFGGTTTTTTPAPIFNKPTFSTGQTQSEQNVFKFGDTPVTTTMSSMFNTSAFNFTPPVPKPPPSNFPTTTSFNSFGSFESKPANTISSSAFGNTKSIAPFGTNQAFGLETKPTTMFGAENKSAPIFGTTQNQNLFGNFNNQIQTPFAAPTPSGQILSSQPLQFGGSANNPPPSVFSFGASSEPAKPPPAASNMPSGVFSFGATTTNNTFGNTPSQTFGAPTATPNAFGMPPPTISSFGTQLQGTAMFNIGSGSSTPKPPRTQLKARRRT